MAGTPRLRLLLDTHVWVWRQAGELDRIGSDALTALDDPAAELCLSPISVWETLVLARKGRLELEPSPGALIRDALRRSATTTIPVTNAIAIRAEELDGFASQDPADRFLVASALEHDLTLVTADAAMRAFEPLRTVW